MLSPLFSSKISHAGFKIEFEFEYRYRRKSLYTSIVTGTVKLYRYNRNIVINGDGCTMCIFRCMPLTIFGENVSSRRFRRVLSRDPARYIRTFDRSKLRSTKEDAEKFALYSIFFTLFQMVFTF